MADIVTQETRGKLFSDIRGLENSTSLLRQLNNLQLKQPTPIQYNCIPPALDGQNVIGAAKTGSGKTMAFVIPIIRTLSEDPYGIFALVLTPTRELAYQIGDQFSSLGLSMGLKQCVVTGGMDGTKQGRELKRSPHVVVATPGRLADIIQTSPEFSLTRIKFLVLDEADRLLDGRFDEQLGVIFSSLPAKRQTLCFSATITDKLQCTLKLSPSKVFVWQSEGGEATVENLQQEYVLVTPADRDAALVLLLNTFLKAKPKSLALVFANTCKAAQIICMTLNEVGISALCLHSMISQRERLAALARFKSSQMRVLVATDVASRGLDIPNVDLVINHSLPDTPKTYIHRVGRTARIGRAGRAVSLVFLRDIRDTRENRDIRIVYAIEDHIGRKFTEAKLDKKLLRRILVQVNTAKSEQQIKLDETDWDERRNINKMKKLIMEGKDPKEEERRKIKRQKRKRKEEIMKKEELFEKLKRNKSALSL